MDTTLAKPKSTRGRLSRIPSPVLYAIYALALAVSISIWFIAIRAPLWTDETGSYWVIKDGISQIWSHTGMCFPSYFYILWLWAKVVGTSEVALRSLSILAMLGAVWLLYLVARELFSREIAFLATIIFCLHPILIFESVDVRPYAFAMLVTNAAILVLLRMRRSDSNWLAAVFGLLAAAILYFHFIFATILPAFVIVFFYIKTGNRKTIWRQFGVATAVFVLAFLPLIPGLYFMFHTAGSHVYEAPPQIGDLLWTLLPALLPFVFCGSLLVAGLLDAFSRKRVSKGHFEGWRVVVCVSLGLIPLLILYGVSAATPIHTFAARHRTDAIPGLALCWALLIERYFNRPVRLLFCVALVACTAYLYFTNTAAREHSVTWKYALEIVQKDASVDNAPLLMCSDFPEADYVPMPLGLAKTSRFFAPLSYYKVTVPVVPLPRALNEEAIRVGSQSLAEATRKHERFLAMGYEHSYETLDWLSRQASADYTVQNLGIFDKIKVLEFDPRVPAIPPGGRAWGQPLRPSAKAASRPARP